MSSLLFHLVNFPDFQSTSHRFVPNGGGREHRLYWVILSAAGWEITIQLLLGARENIRLLRETGKKVSLLVAKTLLPVPDSYVTTCDQYDRVVVAEENMTGRLRYVLYGARGRTGMTGVNGIAEMISPLQIVEEVLR